MGDGWPQQPSPTTSRRVAGRLGPVPVVQATGSLWHLVSCALLPTKHVHTWSTHPSPHAFLLLSLPRQIYEVVFDRQGTFTGLRKAMALKGHAARVLALAFSPDLGRCATASADGTLRLWNIGVRYALNEDPKLLVSVRLPLEVDPKLRVRLAWGGGGVIALSAGHRLAFFDEAEADVLDCVAAAHAAPIAALAWCPRKLTALDRQTWTLASGGGDARVRLWRAPERSAGKRV